MVALIGTKRRTTQPQFVVPIDQSNPLANGLLVVSNTPAERMFSAPFTKATAHGVVTVDPGTQSTGGQNVDSGLTNMPSSGGFSMGWSGYVMPRTTGINTCGIKFRLNYNINSLYHFAQIVWTDTGGSNFVPSIQCGISYSDFTITAAPGPDFYTGLNLLLSDTPVGSRYSLMMTVEDNSPTGLKLYLNGILRTTAATKAVTYSTGANWMLNDNTGEFPQLCAFAWGRTLSPIEVVELHNNPWQIWSAGKK